MKSGDVVIFEHPEHEKEVLTLDEYDDSSETLGVLWSVKEDSTYWYQEKYLRKATKLDKALK